jgi:hypothetical protein
MGGAMALLALSGVRPSSDQITLLNPAALNLSVVTDENSISRLRYDGQILVERAYGTGRGVADNEFGNSIAGAGDYAVVLELSAPVDPVVEIDTGVVFEHPTLTDVQTLATAAATQVVVQPGSRARLAVSAWCLNRELAPPSWHPMSVAPFRVMDLPGTQGEVWAARERTLRAQLW